LFVVFRTNESAAPGSNRCVKKAIVSTSSSVRACEQHFGADEPSAFTGRARLTLGLALIAQGHETDGRAELTRAADLIARAAGADHPWAREARETASRASR
jgi:hypothetical protein